MNSNSQKGIITITTITLAILVLFLLFSKRQSENNEVSSNPSVASSNNPLVASPTPSNIAHNDNQKNQKLVNQKIILTVRKKMTLKDEKIFQII
ncbi:MAG: hypothetical protein Q8869_00515 [Candidatus Phytoplasma australasiaticum]|nr:hypothetical protein [Candidatus Phytoplasma australasiaticum]